MHEFLIDLAQDGRVLQASDQFLNPADRLLDPVEPVADPTRAGSHGAWLDGWETRRVRPPGHEWVIIRLGRRGAIRHVVVDTTHVATSLPAACSVEAIDLPGDPNLVDLVRNRSLWHEVVPQRDLHGSGRHGFDVAPITATHLRLVIYPDGGIARLRALGEPMPPDDLAERGDIDLASLDLGALVIDASDARTSSPQRMLTKGTARGPRDGWMTRRRREAGHEWAVVRLAGRGVVERIEVDTRPFEGDAPEQVGVMGIDLPDGSPVDPATGWHPLLEPTSIGADSNSRFDIPESGGPVTHIRLDLHPDGAVGRFRVFGSVEQPDPGES